VCVSIYSSGFLLILLLLLRRTDGRTDERDEREVNLKLFPAGREETLTISNTFFFYRKEERERKREYLPTRAAAAAAAAAFRDFLCRVRSNDGICDQKHLVIQCGEKSPKNKGNNFKKNVTYLGLHREKRCKTLNIFLANSNLSVERL